MSNPLELIQGPRRQMLGLFQNFGFADSREIDISHLFHKIGLYKADSKIYLNNYLFFPESREPTFMVLDNSSCAHDNCVIRHTQQ